MIRNDDSRHWVLLRFGQEHTSLKTTKTGRVKTWIHIMGKLRLLWSDYMRYLLFFLQFQTKMELHF